MRTEAKLQLYTALEQRNEIESGDKQCKGEINSAFLSKPFGHVNQFFMYTNCFVLELIM